MSQLRMSSNVASPVMATRESCGLSEATENGLAGAKKAKLHGRKFYESLGSPKYVLAPMVDQSEFIWRMLVRSFLPESERGSVLAYTPMFHARLFAQEPKYRQKMFEPTRPTGVSASSNGASSPLEASETIAHLDGNPAFDRPLFVQFCANDPDQLLEAARRVQSHCDAVDLNLGCPQGIARRGHYGAFLQEDQPLIQSLIRRLHKELDVPVTAKIRILDTLEDTLAYAKGILDAGASILTVHGRRREMKGHATGLADWKVLRYLRENLPPDTVIFANGNVLQHNDLQRCLNATGADAVMSAEGTLYDPAIFDDLAARLDNTSTTEYIWRGADGRAGYRLDAVFRRYMDLIHIHVLQQPPPAREPLFVPSPPSPSAISSSNKRAHSPPNEESSAPDSALPPPKKKKLNRAEKKALRKQSRILPPPPTSSDPSPSPPLLHTPNTTAIRAHLFALLRPLVAQHTTVRDALARCRTGDIPAIETILTMVEQKCKIGMQQYCNEDARAGSAISPQLAEDKTKVMGDVKADFEDDRESSQAARERCRRPWWVCQAYVRPLPAEALAKGALQVKKSAAGGEEQAPAASAAAANGTEMGDETKKAKRKREGSAGASASVSAGSSDLRATVNGSETMSEGKEKLVAG